MTNNRVIHTIGWLVVLLLAFALAACQPSQVVVPATVTPQATLVAPTVTPHPTATPTLSPNVDFKLLSRFGESIVTQIAWSPDGKTFAVASSTGIAIYDAKTRQLVRAFDGRVWISSIVFSADGTRLAVIKCPEENCYEGVVELWDVASGKPIRTLTGATARNVVAFSADGKSLVTSSSTQAQWWNVETGQLLRAFEGKLLATSADRQMILYDESAPKLWNISTNKAMLLPAKIFADAAAFSPNGQTLAMSDNTGVHLVQISTARVLQTLVGVQSARKIDFSPDGKLFAVSGYDGDAHTKLWLWDANSAKLVRSFDTGNFGSTLDFAFSPDGRMLAYGDKDGNVLAQEVASGKALFTFPGHGGTVQHLEFSPDNRTLVADEALWDVEKGNLVKTFGMSSPSRRQALLKSDASRLITWDAGMPVQMYKPRDAELITTFDDTRVYEYSSDWVRVAISPDGRLVASSGSNNSIITLRDTATGKPIRKLEGHTGKIISLAFSGDGKTLVSTAPKTFTGSGPAANSDLRVWNVETGALISSRDTYPWKTSPQAFASDQLVVSTQTIIDSCGRGNQFRLAGWNISLPANSEPQWQSRVYGVEYLALTPDNRLAAVATQDSGCLRGNATIVVVDTQTGKTLATLPYALLQFASSLALDPKGTRVAVGIVKPSVSIDVWDVRTSTRQYSLSESTNRATQLAFSPEGNILVSGHSDGKVNVWDANTGKLIQILEGHTASVTSIQFSADNRLLITAANDGFVEVWERK